MLAGVGPVPAALFVVAADEGWARQSAEHLAALDALGVRHGLLAVTRSDLADPELAMVEALDHIAGSSLGRVPAVAVSGVTGAGLDELRAALSTLVRGLPPPVTSGRVRLWIDRAFTIRGSGTVVTGTLGSGRLAVGDELELAPSGRRVRVRGLESLKRRTDAVTAVARVAVNLRGVELADVGRGQALLTPGRFALTSVADVRVSGADPAELGGDVVAHVGSAAVPASLRPLGATAARLRLADPLPLQAGDRVILRDPGGQRVAAGLTVLDAAPPELRRRGAAAARGSELATMPDRPDPAGEVARRGVVSRRQLVAIGALADGAPDPPDAVVAGDWLIAPARWDRWRAELSALVDAYAADNPLAPGVPREVVRRRLDLPDARLVDALVDVSPGLVRDSAGARRVDGGPRFPLPVQEALDELTARLRGDPFAAPEAPELDRLRLGDRELAAAERAGVLAKVGPGVYLLPTAFDEAARRVADLPQPFTLSEARSALGTTRRVAVPLLEALDARGRTRRVDATRREVAR
jgi:selenocysteine-specific elongation factor